MYKPRKVTKTSEEEARDGQPGSSVQHGQPSARQSTSSGQRSTSGRPSQMQVALLNNHPQYFATGRTTSTSRPPRSQLPPSRNPYNEPIRSVYSDNPSRMQVVVIQDQRKMVPRRSEVVLNAMMQPPTEYTSGLQTLPPILVCANYRPTPTPCHLSSIVQHLALSYLLVPDKRPEHRCRQHSPQTGRKVDELT
jgi:hypothetical protein